MTRIVRMRRELLLHRANSAGVNDSLALQSVVSEHSEYVLADLDHPHYPRDRKPSQALELSESGSRLLNSCGPGTELKKILARVGIQSGPDCKCNQRARYMDEMEAKEPGWCERNIEEIVGYLREAAADRGLPFLDVAGRLLIRRAIANARRAALDAPATVNGERNSPDAAGRPPSDD